MDLVNKEGLTPLAFAKIKGHSNVVDLLTAFNTGNYKTMAFMQPFLPPATAGRRTAGVCVEAPVAHPVATVCFSARTNQIPFVQKVVDALKVKGISSYYQLDISKTGPEWDSQWMKAADGAKRIVCILTADYPASEPCCKEFGVAKDDDKLVVVYKDNIAAIKVAPANDFNGKVKMYVKNNGQGLNHPENVDEIVAELEKLL